MRAWRPSHRCIYVIPEIHGAIDELQIILSRILPLRFHNDEHDRVILLGDYIDKGANSANVIQFLIDAQQEYGINFICLKGNHEQLLLDIFDSEYEADSKYRKWMLQGGISTIDSYIKMAGLRTDPIALPRTRFLDIVPISHQLFLRAMPSYLISDGYVFFHGGIDIFDDPTNSSDECYLFDRNASKTIQYQVRNKERPLQEIPYTFVGSHNDKEKLPFVYSKYLMLGGGAPSKLILFELNSMKCAMIKAGKSRTYDHKYQYFE